MKNNHGSENGSNPLIIPIFIMNKGCSHRCIFCNQKISAGNFPQEITKDLFDSEVNSYLSWNKDKSRNVEIAFYGGSFTGIDPVYQEKLLSWAYIFIQEGFVNSLRISTRPDYIFEDNLSVLKKYNVTTIEIGAQSFIDEVLRFAQRGHDAAATVKAVTMLKEHGFRTGLHLMAGLPGDSKEGFIYSLDKTVELKPHTVRIHPVVVFKGTTLAEEFSKGKYRPLELSAAVELCGLAWEKLSAAGIRVIRLGLQLTPEMETDGAVLAGPSHPALGTLVLSSVFYNHTIKLLEKISKETGEILFNLSERDISNFRGLNNMNISAIKKLYPGTKIIVRSRIGQRRGVISVDAGLAESLTVEIPGFQMVS
jgi:histone acetyltransferase (RNA polymerase elongator complex component)